MIGDNGRKARIAELRKIVTSSRGVVERRTTAILFASGDRSDAWKRIDAAQAELAELGVKARKAKRPT